MEKNCQLKPLSMSFLDPLAKPTWVPKWPALVGPRKEPSNPLSSVKDNGGNYGSGPSNPHVVSISGYGSFEI